MKLIMLMIIKQPEYISLPGLEKGEFGYTAFEGDDGFWYVSIPKGGGVTLSVDLAKQAKASGESYRASSPNTGDREDLIMWSAIMLAAMALPAGLIRKRALSR